MGKKFEEILSTSKLNDLLKREEKKECNKKVIFTILAVIGIVAVVAGVAYLVLVQLSYAIGIAEIGRAHV